MFSPDIMISTLALFTLINPAGNQNFRCHSYKRALEPGRRTFIVGCRYAGTILSNMVASLLKVHPKYFY